MSLGGENGLGLLGQLEVLVEERKHLGDSVGGPDGVVVFLNGQFLEGALEATAEHMRVL